MSTRWYYAKAGTNDRHGPVGVEEVQAKLHSGELNVNDIVWRPGLPQWAPIGAMPELNAAPPAPRPPTRLPPVPPPPMHAQHASHMSQPAPAVAVPMAEAPISSPAAPVAESAAQPVGYFTPGADMPARARENLASYAKATGPIGDWPLNDGHVLQLADAVKWRKRILAAAGLTRFFFILYTLLLVVLVLVAVGQMLSNSNFNRDVLPMLIATAVALPFTILFGLAARAIKYCRSWGSLVLAILTTLGILVQIGSLVIVQVANTSGAVRRDGTELIGAVIGLLIGIAIAAVYWRAFSANSRYLESPVWCQEALAVAEKAK